MEMNKTDLRYFTGCALTGLCSNPQFTGVGGQKYLQAMKLTIETLAVKSALEVMEVIARMEDRMDKAEKEEAQAALATKLTSVPGGENGTD